MLKLEHLKRTHVFDGPEGSSVLKVQHNKHMGTEYNRHIYVHTSNEVNIGKEDVTVELVYTDLHVPCLQAIPLSREVQVCPQLEK